MNAFKAPTVAQMSPVNTPKSPKPATITATDTKDEETDISKAGLEELFESELKQMVLNY